MTAPTLGMLGPELTLTTWLVVATVLVVLAVVTVTCVLRARRLDRLHRRTDAARAGLADALERRGTVALQIADTSLRAAACDALSACGAGMRAAGRAFESCEVAENALTRRLAAVDRTALPTGLAGELLDAEQLVVLARRVFNDAVRDTLDLRSRRLVRWLRLAGTAPEPAYFEIADPPRRDVPTPPPHARDLAPDAASGTGVAS